MKRKKWSELEEQTLLSKYSDLLHSGTLSKLKTREKKFKPIADHVNSLHHLHDPITFPFRWSWRDVSIKVQNMRHQYLGVKQKIMSSDGDFNWDDGDNHWENFLMYKEVFGDVELEVKDKRSNGHLGLELFGDGFGFELDCEGFDEDAHVGHEEEEEQEDEEEEEEGGGSCGDLDREENEVNDGKRLKKRRIAFLGAKVLELRDMLVKREERSRDREFAREEGLMLKEDGRIHMENVKERSLRDGQERLDKRELEWEEMQMRWARLEFERRVRLKRELDDERRLKMKLEEKREEEEMEWRERMLAMQIDHEKQMMQMHADACQNQMHILGVMARLMSQYFGSPTDGLGPGLPGLPPQVLHNLHHPGTQHLGHDNKPDSNSPPEYM